MAAKVCRLHDDDTRPIRIPGTERLLLAQYLHALICFYCIIGHGYFEDARVSRRFKYGDQHCLRILGGLSPNPWEPSKYWKVCHLYWTLHSNRTQQQCNKCISFYPSHSFNHHDSFTGNPAGTEKWIMDHGPSIIKPNKVQVKREIFVRSIHSYTWGNAECVHACNCRPRDGLIGGSTVIDKSDLVWRGLSSSIILRTVRKFSDRLL